MIFKLSLIPLLKEKKSLHILSLSDHRHRGPVKKKIVLVNKQTDQKRKQIYEAKYSVTRSLFSHDMCFKGI